MKHRLTIAILLSSILTLIGCKQPLEKHDTIHNPANAPKNNISAHKAVAKTQQSDSEEEDNEQNENQEDIISNNVSETISNPYNTIDHQNPPSMPTIQSPQGNQTIPSISYQEGSDVVETERRSLQTYQQEQEIINNARRPATSSAAANSNGPNEGELVRGGELIMQLQRQLGRQPLLGEMQHKLQSEMGLSPRKARQIIDALGLY
jgi:hypothetical protein